MGSPGPGQLITGIRCFLKGGLNSYGITFDFKKMIYIAKLDVISLYFAFQKVLI